MITKLLHSIIALHVYDEIIVYIIHYLESYLRSIVVVFSQKRTSLIQ